MKHYRYMLVSLAAGLLGSVPAWACSCLGFNSAQEQISAVDLVFEGQVINVALEKDRRGVLQRVVSWFGGGNRARMRMTITTFQVNRAIKGDAGRNIAIRHLAGEYSATCGTDFPRGEPIVVLAYARAPGDYGASLCSQAQFTLDDYVAASEADAPE